MGASPEAPSSVGQKKAAELMQVSKSSVERAHAIKSKGIPELVTAAQNGDIGLEPARDIAQLPKEQQAEALAKAPPKRKPKPKKKQHRVSNMAEIRARSAAVLNGLVGVSKEEFDPDFKGTAQDFIDQYGHVQLWTKKQYEDSNDKVAFSTWIGNIRDLREPLKKYLEGKPFKPENFEAWLKRGTQPEKRRSEMQELASMIVRAKESIEWLVKFLN